MAERKKNIDPKAKAADKAAKIKKALELIASGESVRASCGIAGINEVTFRANVDHAQYARARESCADVQFEEMEDLERLCLGVDLREDEKPLDPGAFKAAMDSRKWRLARMKPKVYGDKMGLEVAGKDGGPIQTIDLSLMDDGQLQEILGRGGNGEGR